MLQVAITPEGVEAALAAGELACPTCSGRLSPWGFARARSKAGARGSAADAPSGALGRVRHDACALTLMDGSAPARLSGGDRRGAAPGSRGRRASSDRQAARTATGHGAWLAACRKAMLREPTRVRDPMDRRAGLRAGRGHTDRHWPGRCGRGDHARRSCLDAAVRPRRARRVGARSLADRRAAARAPANPAVADLYLGRAPGTASSPSSCARRRRVKRRDNLSWFRVPFSRRLTPDAGAATPVDEALNVSTFASARLLLLSYPPLRSPSKAARACPS